METPMCLNPEAPLFIPSSPHPYPTSYFFNIPTQQFHFTMINPNFPPPPTFPAYSPPPYHQNYIPYSPPPPPKLLPMRISNTHLLNIFPSLPKPVPPLILPPTPPPSPPRQQVPRYFLQRQPPFYTDLNLPKPYPLGHVPVHEELNLELPEPPGPPAAPPQSPPIDIYTIPSSVTAVSIQEALTPVTSGPRFPPEGIHSRFPRAGSRKKDQPLEKKGYINHKDKPAPKFADRNFREKQFAGSYKFVVRAKKRSEKRDHEIIPLKEDEDKTTIMIKNIPNQYTRELLMKFLDQHCNVINGRADKDLLSEGEEREGNIVSAYDFLYLPIDFVSRLNKGYAFVNFTDPKAVWKFYDAFNGKSWDLFKSPKIIDIVCAKIEGKEALVSHFESSNFRCESDEYLPVWFDPPRDGLGESVKLHPVGNRHTAKHYPERV